MMFKDKTVMVFGGTGTIGSGIVEQLLKTDVGIIRVFTNDEHSLWKCREKFGDGKMRYLLGDIRNLERVKRSLEGVDYVFNCAAIKQVPIAEYNPMEAVGVNVIGLNNIIDGCFYNGIEKLLHVSSDKAVEPSNLMGMSKAMGERLCWIRDESRGKNLTRISCVRFGNVYGSRGSLVPIVRDCLKNNKKIPITDFKMHRYFITIEAASKFILKSLEIMEGGEIFVPNMVEMPIMDVIEDMANSLGMDIGEVEFEVIGMREGEKLREVLYTDEEYKNAEKREEMVIIR